MGCAPMRRHQIEQRRENGGVSARASVMAFGLHIFENRFLKMRQFPVETQDAGGAGVGLGEFGGAVDSRYRDSPSFFRRRIAAGHANVPQAMMRPGPGAADEAVHHRGHAARNHEHAHVDMD